MGQLANGDEGVSHEGEGAQDDEHEAHGVSAYLRERASYVGELGAPYAARVSAWWHHVTGREGSEPMSYYDQ